MLLDGLKTIDALRSEGARILLRADLNEPVNAETLKLEDHRKIAASASTIGELLRRGASVVILAHQGRPGDADFIQLHEHHTVLNSMLGGTVDYDDGVVDDRALRKIEALKQGSALLLGNVRQLEYEQKSDSAQGHAQRELVKVLSPHFDYFVNDAFAAIHRPHCSMVGFTATLPSAAGRLMEEELRHISPVVDEVSRPSVFIFGGKKFSDFLPVLEGVVAREQVDEILLAGHLANAFLLSAGKSVDRQTEMSIRKDAGDEFFSRARMLLDSGKIVLPADLGFNIGGRRMDIEVDAWPEDGVPMDIGARTIQDYCNRIRNSRTVFISGPPGVYEKEEFSAGTKEIMKAAVESRAYTVAGGGHTGAAAEKFGFSGRLSYISTGGGALEALISGRRIQVLDDLRASASRFSSAFS